MGYYYHLPVRLLSQNVEGKLEKLYGLYSDMSKIRPGRITFYRVPVRDFKVMVVRTRNRLTSYRIEDHLHDKVKQGAKIQVCSAVCTSTGEMLTPEQLEIVLQKEWERSRQRISLRYDIEERIIAAQDYNEKQEDKGIIL